jgi:hypothetical protein
MSDASSHDRLAQVIGRTLQSVEKHDQTWMFVFDSQVAICTQADWRLVMDGGIRATSGDHGHGFGLPAPFDAIQKLQTSVVGRIVGGATIVPDTGDLLLTLVPPARLEFLQLSSGYEAWDLTTPHGRILCIGGGRIFEDPQG